MSRLQFFIVFFIVGSVGCQTNRFTGACSVALCPAPRTTNSSCSTNNNPVCYSYQVPIVNQTFCAPSLSCSLFERCIDDVVCASPNSICLSSTCCQYPICVPAVLGVSTCNSTIPTILPPECYRYTTNTDAARHVNNTISSSSPCDRTSFSNGSWVRFSGMAGTRLTTSRVASGSCGSIYPGFFNGTHPTRLGERKAGSICFEYYDACNWQSPFEVTNCGTYFVYNLPPAPSCDLRYCTV